MKKNPGERVLLKRVIGENNDLFSSRLIISKGKGEINGKEEVKSGRCDSKAS